MSQTSAPKTVDEYIESCPEDVRPILREARRVIREAAPDALEKISWGMPTYWKGENLVHFAAAKRHLGFYPSPEGIEHFAGQLAAYKSSKGAVQFPYAGEIPYALIGEITAWRAKTTQM